MLETKIQSKNVYQGKVLNVRIDTVILPDGNHSKREVVVHPGAVAIVAVNEKEEIILIKQFRHPVGQILWEIPAGKLEKGEDPDSCARRELAEETGFGATKWQKLSTFYTTPGFCDEIMYVYLATELYIDQQSTDDDEFIEVHRIPFAEALQKIKSGDIRDAKSIAGILLAAGNFSA